jgi:hypothetical protein
MAKKRRPYPEALKREDVVELRERYGTCDVCGQQLFKIGGYAGSGMCGPCCTGDSSTIDEVGEEW